MSSPAKKSSSQTATVSASAEKDQKLLLAIIKAANITKIDFNAVAAELGLEKVEAARMRWHRFKKAHGVEIALGKEKVEGDKAQNGTETVTPKRQTGKGKGKAAEEDVKNDDDDDDADELETSPAKKLKK